MVSVQEIQPEYRPLTEEEVESWREAALSHYNSKVTVIGLVSIYCGLTVLPLSHLRSDWLNGDAENLTIFIPAGPMDCDIGRDDGPCIDCRKERDGVYRVGRHAPRYVPVPDEEVADILVNYFSVRDRTGFTNRMVNHYLRQLGEEAGVDVSVSGRNLRYTYGTILARKGFALEEIRDAMGYLEKDTNRGLKHARRFYDWIRDDAKDIYPCGVELGDGSRCQRNRVDPSTPCHFHEDNADLCGVETTDGTPCRLNENCPVHSSHDHVCRAETQYGSKCTHPVPEPEMRCPQHRSEGPGWDTCGAELDDGSLCQNASTGDNGRCWRHDGREQHRCEASTDNGPCRVPVSGPEERCRDHSDGGWEPNRCEYELEDGSLCQAIVSEPDDWCHWHDQGSDESD